MMDCILAADIHLFDKHHRGATADARAFRVVFDPKSLPCRYRMQLDYILCRFAHVLLSRFQQSSSASRS